MFCAFLFAFVSVFLLLSTIFSNPCRYVFNGFVPMTTHMDIHQSLHWSVLVNGTKHLKHERGSWSRARRLMSDGIDDMVVFHGSNFQSYTTGQTCRTVCATTFCGNRRYLGKALLSTLCAGEASSRHTGITTRKNRYVLYCAANFLVVTGQCGQDFDHFRLTNTKTDSCASESERCRKQTFSKLLVLKTDSTDSVLSKNRLLPYDPFHPG